MERGTVRREGSWRGALSGESRDHGERHCQAPQQMRQKATRARKAM